MFVLINGLSRRIETLRAVSLHCQAACEMAPFPNAATTLSLQSFKDHEKFLQAPAHHFWPLDP
jgi:hypothetical protein